MQPRQRTPPPLAALAVATLCLIVALAPLPAAAAAAELIPCAGCFTVPAVPASALTALRDTVYAARPGDALAATLRLDAYAYAPERRAHMPVAVVVHGGACATGGRNDAGAVGVATALAVRGFFAVSLDYRLAHSCAGNGSRMAAEDVRAAVRFLRAQTQWSLDVDRIVAVGMSAGAIAVLEAALLPDTEAGLPAASPQEALHRAHSSMVNAVVSISGAVVDGAALSYANATAAPGPALYFFHGTYDEVLPPDASIQLKERADSRQQPSILRLAPADHVPISLISASYMQDMLWFIRRALRLDAGDTGAADDTGGNAPYVNSTSSSQACLLVDSPVTSHCVGPPTGDQQAAIGDVGLSWSDVISLPNGRKYKFYIPHVYQLRRKPLPVVLALHGEGSDGDTFAWAASLPQAADTYGFILILGEGSAVSAADAKLGQVWNAGSCCAPATTTNVDDVDYARSIIADLSTRNVDYDGLRVSVVGHGNGGMMALRLACEASDQFSAIVSNAATFGNVDSSSCSRPCDDGELGLQCFDDAKCPAVGGQPLPSHFACNWLDRETRLPAVTMSLGMADAFTRYAGGKGVDSGPFSLPVAYSVNAMTRAYGSSWTSEGSPAVPFIAGVESATYAGANNTLDSAVCVTCPDCAANFTICAAQVGGHTWPSGEFDSPACRESASSIDCVLASTSFGAISSSFSATDVFLPIATSASLSDFAQQYLTRISTTTVPSEPPGSPTATLAPSEPVFVCAFQARKDCAMTASAGACQQLPVDRCHGFSGLPAATGLSTVYAYVTVSDEGRYSAALYPNHDCTGQLVGMDIRVDNAELGGCDKLTLPGLGNLLDFGFYATCPLCTPDPSLHTTTTTPSSGDNNGGGGGGSSSSKGSTKSNSSASIAGGVVAGVVVLAVIGVVLWRTRGSGGLRRPRPVSMYYSIENEFGGDEDLDNDVEMGIASAMGDDSVLAADNRALAADGPLNGDSTPSAAAKGTAQLYDVNLDDSTEA